MSDLESRLTQISLVKSGEPLYSDSATVVSIDDDCSGEFVAVEQHGPGLGKITINPEEWPMLRKAIDRMVRECRDYCS